MEVEELSRLVWSMSVVGEGKDEAVSQSEMEAAEWNGRWAGELWLAGLSASLRSFSVEMWGLRLWRERHAPDA